MDVRAILLFEGAHFSFGLNFDCKDNQIKELQKLKIKQTITATVFTIPVNSLNDYCAISN